MRYTFDLSANSLRRFRFFPEAMASLKIPAERPDTLSALVWGVVLRDPGNDPHHTQKLAADVRAALPSSLYLSGWGVLSIGEIRRGDVTVSPYCPIIVGANHQFLTDHQRQFGHSVPFYGPEKGGDDAPEYLFSMVLEQPFGFMALRVSTPGPVRLVVDPRDFVTENQLSANPENYAYDFARVRQQRASV